MVLFRLPSQVKSRPQGNNVIFLPFDQQSFESEGEMKIPLLLQNLMLCIICLFISYSSALQL